MDSIRGCERRLLLTFPLFPLVTNGLLTMLLYDERCCLLLLVEQLELVLDTISSSFLSVVSSWLFYAAFTTSCIWFLGSNYHWASWDVLGLWVVLMWRIWFQMHLSVNCPCSGGILPLLESYNLRNAWKTNWYWYCTSCSAFWCASCLCVIFSCEHVL